MPAPSFVHWNYIHVRNETARRQKAALRSEDCQGREKITSFCGGSTHHSIMRRQTSALLVSFCHWRMSGVSRFRQGDHARHNTNFTVNISSYFSSTHVFPYVFWPVPSLLLLHQGLFQSLGFNFWFFFNSYEQKWYLAIFLFIHFYHRQNMHLRKQIFAGVKYICISTFLFRNAKEVGEKKNVSGKWCPSIDKIYWEEPDNGWRKERNEKEGNW